jgi:uroporphyrinogen decarboxylase
MNTHRKRIESCISNQAPDRPPVALWRHFPVDDQTPAGLARATLDFQRNFDFDLIKVTPSSSYCLKDWGAEDEWRGATEGTRDYTRRVIQYPEDWENLPVLDPRKGNLDAQLQSLCLLAKEIGKDTPIIQTIFNPLAQAKNLAGGESLLVYIRLHPQSLDAGLKTITETTIHFIEAVRKTGIAGIFYAIQHAQYSLLSVEEYQLFGRAYDLQILETTQDMWLKMIHLHGKDVMFDLFADYPVEVINWHDRETPPTIGEGKNLFKNAVCGGIQRDTMVLGTPDQVKSEAQEAIDATSGKRLILGTGCVVPITAPYGNILAARQAVE